jgi:hypothetical protein
VRSGSRAPGRRRRHRSARQRSEVAGQADAIPAILALPAALINPGHSVGDCAIVPTTSPRSPLHGRERIRVRRLPAILAAVAVVIVAGCARQPDQDGTDDPSAAAASEPTASTAAPPTTAPRKKALSRAQAGARYLDIVKPYNIALERLEKGFNSGKPIAELRTLADKVARTNSTQIRQLRATTWPAKVRAPIRKLVAESEAAQRYWRQAAEAGTRNELAQAAVAAGRHDGSEPAADIRKALGLGAYDEDDYS